MSLCALKCVILLLSITQINDARILHTLYITTTLPPDWYHDDVIKWKHFLQLLTLCVGNSPVTGEFPAQSQWRRALMFSLICAWINGYVNNREAGDLRCYHAHYDVTLMWRIVINYISVLTLFPQGQFIFKQVNWFVTVVIYRKTSSISQTKSQNINVSCIPLQLSSLNPLKPCVKLRIKM